MHNPFSELVQTIGASLAAAGQQLALAESCTGGLVAKLITDVAGSSAWFDRGLVTYSNRAKQDLLGVPDLVLARDGAVSEACAEAMVTGLLGRADVDWGIAITGIAGPGGGTADKPVGLVWIAWMHKAGKAEARRHVFPGDRDAVREQAAQAALKGLLDRLN